MFDPNAPTILPTVGMALSLGGRRLPPGWAIRPAEPADATALAANLRWADRAEVMAATGRTPLPVLLESVERSCRAWCVAVAGKPAVLMGVVADPVLPGTGVPWLLADTRMETRPLTVARHSRAVLMAGLAPGFDRLENAVDARSRRTIRWLARLGFQIHPARPMGPAGLPFHPFTLTLRRSAPCVALPSSLS